MIRIPVINKKIKFPPIPLIIQGETRSKTFQFQITESEIDLTNATIFLKWKNDSNLADTVELGVGTEVEWTPNSTFSNASGTVEIQLIAYVQDVYIWQTDYAVIRVFRDILNGDETTPSGDSVVSIFLQLKNHVDDEIKHITAEERQNWNRATASIFKGYYYDGSFYVDDSHQIIMTPVNNCIYVDLGSNYQLYFCVNDSYEKTDYVQIVGKDYMMGVLNENS